MLIDISKYATKTVFLVPAIGVTSNNEDRHKDILNSKRVPCVTLPEPRKECDIFCSKTIQTVLASEPAEKQVFDECGKGEWDARGERLGEERKGEAKQSVRWPNMSGQQVGERLGGRVQAKEVRRRE